MTTRALLVAALSSLLLSAVTVQAANVTWNVLISPPGSATVTCVSSTPAATKILTHSGKVVFAEGSYLDLTFTPNPNYKLESVLKNLENWTPFLDSNRHYRFGPVDKSHLIFARFSVINPQGEFPMQFPANPAEGVAPVYDVTGHYEGTIPFTGTTTLTKPRTFSLDVAMDETGKLDLSNVSVEGLASDPLNEQPTGKLSSFDDKPRVTGSTHGQGQIDGIDLGGSASGSAKELTLTPAAAGAAALAQPQTGTVTGLRQYRGKVTLGDDKPLPFVKKQGPFTMPDTTTTGVTRDWGITLTLQERLVGTRKKLIASALLTLPNQQQLQFAERPVRYSARNGLSVKLTKGIKVGSNPASIDKRSRVAVTRMRFTCNTDGSSCPVTGGLLKYAFLGQKGSGEIADFLAP
jgi:hypothetical protein